VIANPPFSLEAWGEDAWASDPWGRNLAGTPPKKYGDWAWVQHMITSMAPATGRLAVVLPRGALFRMGAEGKIRARILDLDLIEAVIGLGPNLFYGTGLSACIVVARQRKPADRRERILLADASGLYRKGKNQNTLEGDHVESILDCYARFTNELGRSQVVSLDEVRAEGGRINLAGHITQPEEANVPSVGEAAAALMHALNRAWAAEDHLSQLLTDQEIG
jgi:type I restriction enzyme M protein